MTVQQITSQGETINLEWSVVQEYDPPYMWAATFHVRDNSMGDLGLFVINEALGAFLGTTSPYQEQTTPLDPKTNDDGEMRVTSVRVRHQAMEDAYEAVRAIINELEEYLKSKIIFRDQMTNTTTYNFEAVS